MVAPKNPPDEPFAPTWSDAEVRALAQAKKLLTHPGFLVRLTHRLGAPVELVEPIVSGGSNVAGVLKRVALLVASLVVLYLLAPGLITVFGSWRDLESVNPLWFVAMVAAEGLSYAFVSFFTKLILPSASLFGITCAQLAGHALSTVVPGGAATGGAVEYRMMVRSGANAAASVWTDFRRTCPGCRARSSTTA